MEYPREKNIAIIVLLGGLVICGVVGIIGVTSFRTPSEPGVEIHISRTTLKVGETVILSSNPVNIGQPYYTLYLKDDVAPDFVGVAQVRYDDDQVRMLGSASQVLEFVSARANQTEGVFVLRAHSPGDTQVVIKIDGEVGQSDGTWYWGAQNSKSKLITVTD